MTCYCSIENALQVSQGENRTLQLVVRNESRSPIDLTGAAVYFTVKLTTEETATLITKSSVVGPAEVDITQPLKGLAEIYLGSADTDALDAGTYVYDIWVVLAAGTRHHVVTPAPFEVIKPVLPLP